MVRWLLGLVGWSLAATSVLAAEPVQIGVGYLGVAGARSTLSLVEQPADNDGVAGARLELRAGTLAEPATRARLHERFARRGIGAERVGLYGELPYPDLLRAYRHVDIALDPFPFSGCATTCDALWMGCPAVALAGETFEVAFPTALFLSPVGEFSFVIASAALAEHVLSREGHKLAIAVIAMSLLVSPIFFLCARLAHRIAMGHKASAAAFPGAVPAPCPPGPGE